MKGRTLLLSCVAITLPMVLSFVHPWGDLRAQDRGDSILAGADVPAGVRLVIENKCADCHSNRTHWPLYGSIAPASWLIERDVHEARERLNFSTWQQYDADTRIDLLARIAIESRRGAMPLKQYIWLHRSARLTAEQRLLVAEWARNEERRLRSEAPPQ